MSSTTDFDRHARAWLEDGPTELSDRTLEAALAEIHLTRQRRAVRVPWRYPLMPALTRTSGLAAVALVAVIGTGAIVALNAKAPDGSGGQPTLAPTPLATSASPTVAASPAARAVRMPVQGDAASWTVSLPPGWSSAGQLGWYASQGPAGPSGIAVAATGAVNVPGDPCDGTGKVSDAASPADVVAGLVAREDLTVSTPVATTLSGYAALQVDVEVPADISACDSYIIFAEPDGSGFYAQGPSNRLRVWVVDIDGRPTAFFVESFAATPATDVAAAQQIVDSIVITP